MRAGSFARHVLSSRDAQKASGAVPEVTVSDNEDAAMDAIEDVLTSLATALNDNEGASAPTTPTLTTEQRQVHAALSMSNPFAALVDVPENAAPLRARLGDSVRRGELNPNRALQASRFVDREVRGSAMTVLKMQYCVLLVYVPMYVIPALARFLQLRRLLTAIEQLGTQNAKGQTVVSYGKLVRATSSMFFGTVSSRRRARI